MADNMGKGETTRQRIIALAAPLFNERGFAGCSMQDIMAATGLEKGGIYRHFKSKEELAIEAFKYARRVVVDARKPDLLPDTTGLEQLREMIDLFVSRPNPIKGGCPLMNTAVDSDDGNAELRTLSRKAFADWRKRIRSIISQAIAKGEVRSETNASQIADLIVASLEGALVLSRLDETPRPLQHVQMSLNGMLSGLAGKQGS